MSLPSATVRTVFMAQTGFSLSVGVLEPSGRVKELTAPPGREDGSPNPDLEAALVEVSSGSLGVARNRFMTFSEWGRILDLQLGVVQSPDFQGQLVASYSGGSKKIKARFARLLDRHREHLETLKWRFRDPGAFASGMVNQMLIPGFLMSGPNLHHHLADLHSYLSASEEGGADPYFFLTLSWDLLNAGVSEVELSEWSMLSSLLSARTYHSVKALFEEVQRVEVPIARPGRSFVIGDLYAASRAVAGAIINQQQVFFDGGPVGCPVLACAVGESADVVVYVSPGLFLARLLSAVGAGRHSGES